MVSGPRADFELLKPALDVIGKVFFIGEKPGSAQTMKLANNFLSATAMVATSEAVVMGVKSGLDPAVMIDVINAGSGMNTASRDKFPRAVLPRSFDFGFATGLMVKDVRLALEEMKSLGLSMEVAEAVGRLWEIVIRDMGPESRFHRGDQADREGGGRGGGRRQGRQSRGEVISSSLVADRDHSRAGLLGSVIASSDVDHVVWVSPAPGLRHLHHSHGAGLSIAISSSTSMRGRTTAYWSSLTSTSGISARVL